MLIENRKAYHEYHIIEKYRAGISLIGSEVKQIRKGKVSLVQSYCYFNDNELILKNLHIPVENNFFQHEPNRERKLLLRKKEIRDIQKSLIQGMTMIPLSVIAKDGKWIKVDIALVKGKKLWDKRQSEKEKDQRREIDRQKLNK
jgi:SsrA-binding protein